MSFDVKEFLQSLYRIVNTIEVPSEWTEDYQERAAILEYDGSLSREMADVQALQEIAERIRDAEII